MPRACPVEVHVGRYKNAFFDQLRMPRPGAMEVHVYVGLATSVRLHGTSPWHPKLFVGFGSDERETPRDKPVASCLKAWDLAQRRGITTYQPVATSIFVHSARHTGKNTYAI